MIRNQDGTLTGYIYIDLKNTDYGGFVRNTDELLHNKSALRANYSFQWSGEYELELRVKQRLQLILPVVFLVIFLLLYKLFHSVAEALVLIFPTIYAMSGGLLLQWLLRCNFSVAVAVGYSAIFGIAEVFLSSADVPVNCILFDLAKPDAAILYRRRQLLCTEDRSLPILICGDGITAPADLLATCYSVGFESYPPNPGARLLFIDSGFLFRDLSRHPALPLRGA
jgi:hypothetical protein